MDELEKRRTSLEAFITQVSQRTDAYSVRDFVNFLELDEHQPQAMLNPLS
jgi:hypothetical protein